ncbi:acetate--CoA ligase family protein [Natrialbaceae archaeon A-CW1-1]
MRIEKMFCPRSIAVIGASDTPGKLGYEAMQNAAMFDGPVYPVNPSRSGAIFNREFIASVSDIDHDVDLALICVPAPVVPEIVEECSEAGVNSAVIFAGGFGEAGSEGQELQDRLLDVISESEIHLLGPNTSGFFVPSADLYGTFVTGIDTISPGNVAIVAQSGGLAFAIAFQAENEGIGLSAVVGLGNRINVSFEEIIEYFDSDENTDAIVLHVEGTDNGRILLETCRSIDTPIVAYKVGKYDVGDFAESHTGALTGEYELYEAGFNQFGVPSVRSTTELLDAGKTLALSPQPKGSNIGIITAQAGPGIAIMDHVRGTEATLPSFTDDTRRTVEELLPGFTYSLNPVDTGRPMAEFGDVIAAVAHDDNIDIVLVYELYESGLGYPVETLSELGDEVRKPIILVTGGPEVVVSEELAEIEEFGIPTFRTPERGANAVKALVQYAERNRRPNAVSVQTEGSTDD